MTKTGLLLFLLLCLTSPAWSQKVKYKDIFALLSTKQYEQAEPFLKRYLAQTTDNPNAYLYMGMTMQEKALKNDVLKQTDIALANMDSAIFYYDRAYKTLDDREVRKNKEYYQAYNRRDLRTGASGVKLSDIQFDIEKRIEGLKQRQEKLRNLKHHFSLAEDTYQRAHAVFTDLQHQFPALNTLYLRATPETLKALDALTQHFDSTITAFDTYKETAADLGRTGYKQERTLQKIADYSLDGRSVADFYAEEIPLWDYKSFAGDARGVIEEEILPMRQHLVAYYTEIDKLRQKFERDSVSVRSDLTSLIDRLLYEQLRAFDDAPLPMWIFALKTGALEYLSVEVENETLRDSADVHFQLHRDQVAMKVLERMDSTLALVSEARIREKAPDYAMFVADTYGDAEGVIRFAAGMRDFVAAARDVKSQALTERMRALNYILDASDSIPLTDEVVGYYKPLFVSPEEYTSGIVLDSAALQGYFYTIVASRGVDVKAKFPLDKTAFRVDNIVGTHSLVQSDPDGQLYYILFFSEEAIKDKFPVTLAKVYRSDGLAWHTDHRLPFLPVDLVLSSTGEVVISNGEDEVVIDKGGAVVR